MVDLLLREARIDGELRDHPIVRLAGGNGNVFETDVWGVTVHLQPPLTYPYSAPAVSVVASGGEVVPLHIHHYSAVMTMHSVAVAIVGELPERIKSMEHQAALLFDEAIYELDPIMSEQLFKQSQDLEDRAALLAATVVANSTDATRTAR